jgi:hypothetical protein
MSLAVHYSEGGSLNHTDITSIFLSVDEIDTVKATDSILLAVLEEAVHASVQITRYNATTVPFALTPASGLGSYEQAVERYLEISASENVQNATSDIIENALIQIYYKESDLDKTGNGFVGDPGDLDENTLVIYFFNETAGSWTKLSIDVPWVVDFGVNTTNVKLYGESYAGYVWAHVSRFSFYGLAGLTFNRPPNATDAYPSKKILWPPNHKFVPITIEGVTDPDGDNVTITITSITSNEPEGCSPDSYGVGTDTAWLRAERLGKGKGRVYVITFVASDGKGGEAIGNVSVFVPHGMGKWCHHKHHHGKCRDDDHKKNHHDDKYDDQWYCKNKKDYKNKHNHKCKENSRRNYDYNSMCYRNNKNAYFFLCSLRNRRT